MPHRLIVPPLSRRTIDGETLPGLAGASFSMVLESDALVTLDRTMSWDGSGYGSHAETGSGRARRLTWYLAEGSTSGDFTLFYLLQNPHVDADRGDRPLPAAVGRANHPDLHPAGRTAARRLRSTTQDARSRAPTYRP